ncbi:tetratricopeptide repeat protein [Motiliproteus sp. SC1-56]|uniref:tetratricopeptide repeat protein n=1 Tax=Motiliproteus sp. SC1-56 TaxID=2799565 RepID=UPI001A9030D5|nr:tetratricopeptide repeat protein [Motiliproteus sp. SC1-56]
MPVKAHKGDRRPLVLAAALLFVAVAGALIGLLPGDWSLTTVDKEGVVPLASPALAPPHGREKRETPSQPLAKSNDWRLQESRPATVATLGDHALSARREQVDILFEHGVAMLRKGDTQQAVTLFDQVLKLAPRMSEAYVNRGYARAVESEHELALVDFHRAIDLYPSQANAYYGAAQSYEALGDLEAALGAMRSFIHLSTEDSVFITRARSAIWEWGEQLRLHRQEAVSSGDPASPQESEEGRGDA